MPILCSFVISLTSFVACLASCVFVWRPPATHVELTPCIAPERSAGPDSHGQCVKPAERKTTRTFCSTGSAFKDRDTSTGIMCYVGQRELEEQERLTGEMVFLTNVHTLEKV